MMKVESPGAGTGAFEYKWYYQNLMHEVLSFVPEESDHPSAVVSWSGNYSDPLSSTEDSRVAAPTYKVDYVDGFLRVQNFGNQAEVQVYTYDLQGRLLSQSAYQLVNGLNQFVQHKLSDAAAGCYPTIIVDKKTKAFSTYKVMKN